MLNRLPRTLPGEYIVAVGTLSPVLALPSALAFVAGSWFIAQAIRASSMPSSDPSIATAGVLVTMVYGIGCMVLAIGFAVRAFVTWMTTTFVVTNRRVVSAYGLLRRVEVELPLSSVTGVIVRQHLLGLVLSYGTVTALSAGGDQCVVRSVDRPNHLRQVILNLTSSSSLSSLEPARL